MGSGTLCQTIVSKHSSLQMIASVFICFRQLKFLGILVLVSSQSI